jgi:hypothetical protein
MILRRADVRPIAAAPGFTHVVSLGLSCRVTYQMRLHFRSAASFPFDWWISPIRGLANYLEDPDPDRIFAPGQLRERIDDGFPSTIVSREFGFQLFHEFPRHKAAPPAAVVSPGWQAHVGEVRERHERRMARLMQTDQPGSRVLFVRHQLGPEIAADAAFAAVDELWRALVTRFKHAQVHLLLVNLPPVDAPSPRVTQLQFEDPAGPPPESWRGDAARWRAALEGAGIGPAHKGKALAVLPSPGEKD